MLISKERREIVEFGKKMIRNGLVKGTGGNLSLCNDKKTMVAMTPTGIPYEEMEPKDVVVLDLEGNQIDGELKPSSEISFHLGLINLREDIQAVVHTHSIHATTLACLGWEIPPIHYLIGLAGTSVQVAPYATYGSEELSKNICNTIAEGNAVLLANHGMVATSKTLPKAFAIAEMVEYVAQLYLQARSVGNPVVLSREDMDDVLEKFQTYGKQKNWKNN